MTILGHQDEFPIESTLICMLTHYTGPMVSHELRLLSSDDFTKLLHCVISQP